MDVRVLFYKTFDMVDENGGPEFNRAPDTDAEPDLLPEMGNVLLGPFKFIKNFFTGLVKGFSGPGQGRPLPFSLNQRGVNGGFQFFDGMAHSTLGNKQMFGSFCEIFNFRQGEKYL
jgi:hypothetical protein